jgi:hypothetical protein
VKYSNYTWNTGHVLRHDSDVDLWPSVVPAVRALIAAGSGEVPGCVADYNLVDLGRSATLSAWTLGADPACIWATFFWLAAPEAEAALFAAGRTGVERSPRLPERLASPGLLTVIMPGAELGMAQGADIGALADFAKTVFSVWGIDRLRRD